MTELSDQADRLIELVQGLNASVESSNERISESNAQIALSNQRIAELGTFGKSNRKFLRMLAGSVVLDIALSVALGFSFAGTHHASDKATSAAHVAQQNSNQNAATAKTFCISSNQARAADEKLWTYVFSLVPVTNSTEMALSLVKTTFAPHVC